MCELLLLGPWLWQWVVQHEDGGHVGLSFRAV